MGLGRKKRADDVEGVVRICSIMVCSFFHRLKLLDVNPAGLPPGPENPDRNLIFNAIVSKRCVFAGTAGFHLRKILEQHRYPHRTG